MIQPLKDFLLLKDLDNEGQTEGGIYVPSSVGNEAKVKRGEVVAIGPDLAGAPPEDLYVPTRSGNTSVAGLPDGTRVFYIDIGSMEPKDVDGYLEKVSDRIARKSKCKYAVGDTVLYSIYGGNEVRDGNQKYWLVPDKEVWGKVSA